MGLNFENPDDKQSKSMISFGYFDYSNVEGGKDGLNYYSNIGLNHWAVLMDDIQLGQVDIGGIGGGKMALIDSGNTSIQIPASQFSQLRSLLQAKDKSIYVVEIEEK